jgi:threonine dehydratase
MHLAERSQQAVKLDEISAAQRRIAPFAVRTPLVRLEVEDSPAEIYLKLENLQPVGSFKQRGATNALVRLTEENAGAIDQGVWTASAGNMGYALAWAARRMSVPCAVIVPDDAPRAKLEAIDREGARIQAVPFAIYQEIQRRHTWRGLADLPAVGGLGGRMVHPFADPAMMAGSGTIALEVLEDLPEVDAVLVPYGGGGLSCGIAAALKGLKPQARVLACEVETAAPLAASLAKGEMAQVAYRASFVSGIGGPAVFADMWPLSQKLLDGAQVVTLAQVRQAIRILAERAHVVAEGAGAVAVAAALLGAAGTGKLVCIVSGGNIDHKVLVDILQEGGS